MSSRVVALIAFLILGAATVLAAGFLTPWRPAPATPTTAAAVPRPDPSTDFSDDEIARGSAFRAAVRPWSLSRMVLGLVVAVALGLTPLGARLIGAAARPLGGSWWVQALIGGIVLSLVATVVTLPLAARSEVILRRYGLSTQNWTSWFADLGKGWAISAVLTAVITLVLYALIRATPSWWWTWAAGGAAAFVFLASFAFPVLIEPVFNKFTPMPDSALRTQLLQLAAGDGEPVKDVLVADASRRTTALNAYVSGFGASRRIVVYDTLLKDAPPDEVESVVAHELGHAVDRDVVTGTVLGALGAAAAVCGLAVVGAWSPLLRRAGVDDLTDPRSLALLLAIVAVVGALSTPIQSVVSRKIEARADEHSLELTRDPEAFVSMERRLALVNRADLRPNPFYQFWFGTHPTTVERIAAARDFAAREDLPIPGPAR
ncbi:M48 family metallopeptidase [Cryptosporangium phraense]|uniref:M48 family metallopeptidase n=1 Tax=Cryptosporangium phraense TaxID=2593070 RepID=A0A545ATB4_9ACTN|nr:M48 family metallopeptidase [Cryptosporangium phraense]TQS44574.1 M48 family metallopeptidase [Cryptosporangium phraense]